MPDPVSAPTITSLPVAIAVNVLAWIDVGLYFPVAAKAMISSSPIPHDSKETFSPKRNVSRSIVDLLFTFPSGKNSGSSTAAALTDF